MRKLLRNGALILLVLSCVVFIGTLTYQLLMVNTLQRESAVGMVQEQLPSMWVTVIGAVSGTISSAAIPFFGACLIDRIDQLLARKEAAE